MSEPTVTERDAVERERKAFVRGANYRVLGPNDDMAAAAAFLYPLPMKPVQYSEPTGDGQ